MQYSRQKRGKFGLLDAPAQKWLRSSQAADFIGQDIHELGLGIRTAIGQLSFKMIPHALIRIQFWGIRREGLQV
jgi:hypothetical protein